MSDITNAHKKSATEDKSGEVKRSGTAVTASEKTKSNIIGSNSGYKESENVLQVVALDIENQFTFLQSICFK